MRPRPQGYDKQERDESAVFTGGVPYPNGTYHRTAYYYEDYVFVGWSQPGETDGMGDGGMDREPEPAGRDRVRERRGGAGTPPGWIRLLGKLGLTEEAGATGGAVGGFRNGSANKRQRRYQPPSTSAAAASSQATAALPAASEAPGCQYYGTAAPAALLGGPPPEPLWKRG